MAATVQAAQVKRYISVADTAKLVREALKEAFAGVKFTVRSKRYAGGASITVGWTDGPTGEAVNKIVSAFKGGYFDAMTDYKGGNVHQFRGEVVHFGADFIFTERALTVEALRQVQESVGRLADGGRDLVPADIVQGGHHAWFEDKLNQRFGGERLVDYLRREAAKVSFGAYKGDSKTASESKLLRSY